MRIVEVGPRDGLQSIRGIIPADRKVRWIQSLRSAGLRELEVASFVSARWVPQMGDSATVCQMLKGNSEGLWGLVPNQKGFLAFQDSGLSSVAFFTAVSDEFNRRNVNRDFKTHLQELRPLVDEARSLNLKIRLYVSTVFDCPYSGRQPLSEVLSKLALLADWPIDDLSLGDTIGMAVPQRVRSLARAIKPFLPAHLVSWHFHDTYGMAIANVAEAMEQGYCSFDTSASGLGGCPYAPGASGNLATEDLVFFLHEQGINTGISLSDLIAASEPMNHWLNRSQRPKSVRTK